MCARFDGFMVRDLRQKGERRLRTPIWTVKRRVDHLGDDWLQKWLCLLMSETPLSPFVRETGLTERYQASEICACFFVPWPTRASKQEMTPLQQLCRLMSCSVPQNIPLLKQNHSPHQPLNHPLHMNHDVRTAQVWPESQKLRLAILKKGKIRSYIQRIDK